MKSIRIGRCGPWGRLAITACAFFAGLVTTSRGQAPMSDKTGVWSDLIDMRNVPVHAHVLPSGKLLYWGRRESNENLDGVDMTTGKVPGSSRTSGTRSPTSTTTRPRPGAWIRHLLLRPRIPV